MEETGLGGDGMGFSSLASLWDGTSFGQDFHSLRMGSVTEVHP